MTTLLDIGNQLRQARQQRKLYKVRVAAASGVHRNTVSDLEAGLANVELNTLLALCEHLELDVKLVPKQPRKRGPAKSSPSITDGK